MGFLIINNDMVTVFCYNFIDYGGGKMNKYNEREIAVLVLMDIFQFEKYNNITLRNTLNKYEDLDNKGKAFITELVNGTIRNKIYIDYIIDYFSNTKTTSKKMKPFILNLLRISVYQIKFLDKIPVSAAINEGVNLAKKKGFKGLSGFVNGLLRNISRNLENVHMPKNKLEYMHIKYSFPMELIKYYLDYYSMEEIEKMLTALLLNPWVSICTNTLKVTNNELKMELEKEKVEFIDDFEKGFGVKGLNLNKSNAFSSGLFHVMDKNAINAIEILNPQMEDNILDLCGAPGGKSFISSYLMEDTGSITTCDIYDHKINLINQMKDKLGITNISAKINDASILNNDFVNHFHKVILDVPCSGLGLIKKKPDIKYNKTIEDIKELQILQREIIDNGSKYVKENGYLLYSTCTISPLENEENTKWFLEKYNYELLIEKTYLCGINTDYDGFYIALFKKKDK